MIIDQKGKLFGIINIIDLLLIIVILAVGVFAFVKLGSGNVITNTNQKFIVKYYTEEVSTFCANQVKVGDYVIDEAKNLSLGKVTDVKVGPSVFYAPNSNGEMVKTTKNQDDFSSIEITTEMEAQPYTHGFKVEGNLYSVNHGFTIRAGLAKIYLRVSGIEAQ